MVSEQHHSTPRRTKHRGRSAPLRPPPGNGSSFVKERNCPSLPTRRSPGEGRRREEEFQPLLLEVDANSVLMVGYMEEIVKYRDVVYDEYQTISLTA